ncbi:hypothetical protein [Natronospira sp.]|uniref:hypothetical protein n=1 Tax=Natronospira sp. TaxID=2024970 RepID=UPI003872E341
MGKRPATGRPLPLPFSGQAAGIRTRISPRFELGGGPRVGGVSRLDPESGEALMQIHGVFELSDQVAISGSYDYHGDDRQWRL